MLKIHLLVLNVSAPVPEMMVLPRKDQLTPVARGAATALHTSWGERPAAAACTALQCRVGSSGVPLPELEGR